MKTTPATIALHDDGSLDWQWEAACRESNNYWFFMNEGKGNGYDAKRVCAKCPVINVCLDYAITLNLTEGVYGGMNKRERRLERYRRRRLGIEPN